MGWRFSRALLAPCLVGILCLVTAAARAAPLSDLSGGQTGAIEYNSITPGGMYQLVTKAAAPSIVITGTLTFPNSYSGKIPAMVLAHHCNGITTSVTNLAAMLRGLGIATFMPDSFTPRGYPGGVCIGGGVNHADQAADALNALKLLATHPNIDPNRIGIIGQSFGGYTINSTAYQEVRTSIISGPLKFAVHVSLYGAGCSVRHWSPNMTGSPMLVLLGAADDWTPPGECLSYSVLRRSLGPQTTTILYPDAPHAWDSGAYNYDANRTSYGNCRYQFRLDTLQSSRYDTGEILGGAASTAYLNSCLTKGAHSGSHPATTALATKDITIFLAKNFNLSGVPTPASQPDRIFNCAENVYPQVFAPKGSASQTGQGYYYRYYNQTNSYIGTQGGTLYYYVPNQSPNINAVGPESTYLNQAAQAGC